MHIPPEVFLENPTVFDFGDKDDIGNLQVCHVYSSVRNDCEGCKFFIGHSTTTDIICATEYKSNPELKESVDNFLDQYPEYAI